MTAPDVTPAVERVGPWRCFHCDEVFTDRRCAAAHFGASEDADPACQIKMGGERTLLEALRQAEKEAGDAWAAIHAESTEAARSYYAQQGRHRDQITATEQVGYERGLADAQKHPETLGLVSAADHARLSAALGEAGLRAADLIGSATHQVSVTVTITARGDETHADLRSGGLSVLAGFECAGGLNRIRVGDPVLGAKDRFHTADRQAHAAFVRHSARTALQQQEK